MQGVYDELADALCDVAEGGHTPTLIRIGWEAWCWLRRDVRSFGTLVICDGDFFFQNVRIDPWDDDVDPSRFEVDYE